MLQSMFLTAAYFKAGPRAIGETLFSIKILMFSYFSTKTHQQQCQTTHLQTCGPSEDSDQTAKNVLSDQNLHLAYFG